MNDSIEQIKDQLTQEAMDSIFEEIQISRGIIDFVIGDLRQEVAEKNPLMGLALLQSVATRMRTEAALTRMVQQAANWRNQGVDID